MKEYITGANGFVGKHLVEKVPGAITIPHEQILSTNLEPFNRLFFLSTFGNMSFHDDLDAIIRANLLDLVFLSSQAKFVGFKSFVYVSTSSVRLPRQTMYSRSKKAGEEIMLGMAENTGMSFCSVRPYSITGVGEQKKHLIPKLINSCLTGEPMDFVPSPVHDFVDVEDVVDALLNLSENEARGVFEVGTGVGYSNEDVKEIVESVTGRKAKVNYVQNMRDYDTEDWVCKNYRARSFGWLPTKSLEDSIREMVAINEN